MDVMTKDLRVMDATAIAFCRDNKIPIVVFDMSTPGSLRAILEGDQVGTIIRERWRAAPDPLVGHIVLSDRWVTLAG